MFKAKCLTILLSLVSAAPSNFVPALPDSRSDTPLMFINHENGELFVQGIVGGKCSFRRLPGDSSAATFVPTEALEQLQVGFVCDRAFTSNPGKFCGDHVKESLPKDVIRQIRIIIDKYGVVLHLDNLSAMPVPMYCPRHFCHDTGKGALLAS